MFPEDCQQLRAGVWVRTWLQQSGYPLPSPFPATRLNWAGAGLQPVMVESAGPELGLPAEQRGSPCPAQRGCRNDLCAPVDSSTRSDVSHCMDEVTAIKCGRPFQPPRKRKTECQSLLWFNRSQQLSTTQPLAHSPLPQWDGGENWKKGKTRGLR